MPLIDPALLQRSLVADPLLLEHLRQREDLHRRLRFSDFMSECGILDIGELNFDQLKAFIAARRLAGTIDLLRIPSGKSHTRPNYAFNRPHTSINVALRDYLTPSPADEYEIGVLRDPEDIPLAVPEDLLLRRKAPKEFLRRLTTGELLRNAYLQAEIDPLRWEPTPEEASQEEHQQEDLRPRGYLLLDASESMGTSRDPRGSVARGLAIAFLWSQYESGNPSFLRFFSGHLSEPYGGSTRREFLAAIAEALTHSNSGMTSLQNSLGELCKSQLGAGGRVDIVLITDGLTRLTEDPTHSSHLHTYLLGERPEQFDRFSDKQYEASLHALEDWSDHFFFIGPDHIAEAVVPRLRDVFDVGRGLASVERELRTASSAAKIDRIKNRLRNIEFFASLYLEKTHHDEVANIRAEAQRLSAEWCVKPSQALAMENAESLTAMDRDLLIGLEQRELRSSLDAPEALAAELDFKSVREMDFREFLRHFLSLLHRWIYPVKK